MRKFDKIILSIISLLSIGLSIGLLSLFYPVPYVQGFVSEYMVIFPWINDVFAGYIIFVCLFFFILLLLIIFIPSKTDFLIFSKNKGKIQFSRRTIESTIRYSFADLEAISSSRVKVKLNRNPNKTRVYVKLAVNNTQELASLTESVQEKIVEALQASLSITVKSVAVKVIEPNPTNKTEKEADELMKGGSRVL